MLKGKNSTIVIVESSLGKVQVQKENINFSTKKFGKLEVNILRPMVPTEINLIVIGPATLFHTSLDITPLQVICPCNMYFIDIFVQQEQYAFSSNNFNLSKFAEIYEEIICDYLGLKKFFIFAHSSTTHLAVEFAKSHSSYIQGLILVTPYLYAADDCIENSFFKPNANSKRKEESRKQLSKINVNNGFIENYQKQLPYFALDKEKLENLWKCYYQNEKFILNQELVVSYFDSVKGRSLELPAYLKIFILFGMQDLSTDYFSIIDEIEKIKTSKDGKAKYSELDYCILDEADHYPMTSHETEFFNKIQTAIQSSIKQEIKDESNEIATTTEQKHVNNKFHCNIF